VIAGHDRRTRCFEERIGAWFGGEGRRRVTDRAYLRQMNMALALAYSRWLELAEDDAAAETMATWLDEVERRAVARAAGARAEAIRQARDWFDACR
jgi:hypothetical protein